MMAVQNNKLSTPEVTSDGLKYLTFMKMQPFYILARICDSMGNVFDSTQFYSYYNVGDLAINTFLQTKDFTFS